MVGFFGREQPKVLYLPYIHLASDQKPRIVEQPQGNRAVHGKNQVPGRQLEQRRFCPRILEEAAARYHKPLDGKLRRVQHHSANNLCMSALNDTGTMMESQKRQ